MPALARSLLDTSSLSETEILNLFSHSDLLAARGKNFYNHGPQRVVCLLFFEPSTRTRMSFQTAAYRLGHHVSTMELFGGSSLAKGETFGDTVLNILAMQPDVLVIRYGKSSELDELLPTLSIPVISGGCGTRAHPTQALLDAYTISRELKSIKGQRVLIVGDVRHSRVARSNFDVLTKLGAEIAVCGPQELLPSPGEVPGLKIFGDLDEAVGWASVYMGLRIQLERHNMDDIRTDALGEYHRQFGLTASRLEKLSKDAIIMHPGPINHGVEFSAEVLKDPRSRVMQQVTNGVLIRAALLSKVLGEKA